LTRFVPKHRLRFASGRPRAASCAAFFHRNCAWLAMVRPASDEPVAMLTAIVKTHAS
jgi:hypothetical protein